MKSHVKRRTFLTLAGGAAVGLCPLAHAARSLAAAQKNMNHLTYALHDGWVHNWLNAGPHVVVIPSASYKFNPELRPPVIKRFYLSEPEIKAIPVEGDSFTVDGETLGWEAFTCRDDHLIDQAFWYGSSRYMKGWSFVQLENPGASARDVSFQLFTNGPADVWMNENHVFRTEAFDYVNPNPSEFVASLAPGINRLFVRREHVMALGGPFVLALRLSDPKNGASLSDVRVLVPTHSADPVLRQELETAFDRAHLSRDNYAKGDAIVLNVPRVQGEKMASLNITLQKGKTVVRRVVWNTGEKSQTVSLGSASDLIPGDYQVILSADEAMGGIRRELRCSVLDGRFFSAPPVGTTWEARRDEVLEAILKNGGKPLNPQKPPGNLLWSSQYLGGEVAKMHLGRWAHVAPSTLMTFIGGLNRREDGGDFRMVDLCGILLRFGAHPRFPADVAEAARNCVLGFKYWTDEPGQTAMNFGSENHQIAIHTAEILAGQLYPDDIFTNNKQTGNWHRQHGEKLALTWLQKRAAYGWEEWDANGYLAHENVSLSHLLSLAQNEPVRVLAHQVTDSLFLSIALNSFKGSFGSTHGRTGWDYIRDSRNEPVAPLAYLAWGTGAINEYSDINNGLILANYRVPGIIAQIALDQGGVLWNRERQGLDPRTDAKEAQGPTDKVTYKTPDFMLASAQDWKLGQNGYQQHIWQATLGPDAVVFTTSPAFMSENGNNRPNFWMGNKTLPRVAQWKETLVAVYKGRPTDWLQWTHAYFPTWAFDEYKVSAKWAFARKGDGYLALSAKNGLTLTEEGDNAYRELRSPGRENVWLCHMGRKETEGDFAAWQAKIAALPTTYDGLNVQWKTKGGQVLRFGWEGPLLLDGKEQAITGFPHFDSPYAHAAWPAEKLEIMYGTQKRILDFGRTKSEGESG